MSRPLISAYDWVPEGARGLVRDIRVRWACEEVGLPYDVRLLRFGTQRDPAHRARQPFGQVPTYEEDGLVLFESGAIVLHIAQHHPGLLPEDPGARARAIEWMFAALSSIEPGLIERFHAAVIERDQPWAQQRLPIVDARVRSRLAELSDRLGDADWLDGAFSAGDLMMVSTLRVLRNTGLADRFANIAAYIARGEARPAFQRALAAQMAGFTGGPPAGLAA